MPNSNHRYFTIFLVMVALTGWVFRDLVFHLNSALLDWNDFPYYVWTIIQQAEHFKSFELTQIGNGKIFYPHQGVMFFSDLLLPHAFLATIFSFFTSNPILIFNLVFFVTLGLNAAASIYLWKQITSKFEPLLLATLVTTFSPFIFLQLGHIQMITLWPFLFALGVLIQQKQLSIRRTVMLGLWMAVLFISSVYLTVFFLTIMGLWYLTLLVARWQKQENLISPVFHAIISFSIFAVVTAPIWWTYLKVQEAYQITRSYGEYIFYAAHVTDYLFQPYRSLLSTTLFAGWNKFNLHEHGEVAGWPSFTVLLLALVGLFQVRVQKLKLNFSIPIDQLSCFFGLLIFVGLTFSLGPRLNVNGHFANIPMPYHFVLKLNPVVEPVRATARWSLMFYLGLTYFMILGLGKFDQTKYYTVLLFATVSIFCLEILPLQKPVEAKQYYQSSAYDSIASSCNDLTQVLLEYPMNRMIEDQKITDYLTYKTQIMLAALHHNCYLVNGYSGYTPYEIEQYELSLNQSVTQIDGEQLEELLLTKDIAHIKVNLDALEKLTASQAAVVFNQLSSYELIASDEAKMILRSK